MNFGELLANPRRPEGDGARAGLDGEAQAPPRLAQGNRGRARRRVRAHERLLRDAHRTGLGSCCEGGPPKRAKSPTTPAGRPAFPFAGIGTTGRTAAKLDRHLLDSKRSSHRPRGDDEADGSGTGAERRGRLRALTMRGRHEGQLPPRRRRSNVGRRMLAAHGKRALRIVVCRIQGGQAVGPRSDLDFFLLSEALFTAYCDDFVAGAPTTFPAERRHVPRRNDIGRRMLNVYRRTSTVDS